MSTGKVAVSSPRIRVLVVDDDPSILVTAAAILEDFFDVFTAEHAEAAIAKMRTQPVDVVCTDFVMPGMDGLALLAHVGAQPGFIARVLISGQREHRDKWEKRRD